MLYADQERTLSGGDYILRLYQSTKGDKLTIEHGEGERITCFVEWDEQTARELALKCEKLLAHLFQLGEAYDTFVDDPQCLSGEAQDVWNTYVRPFPDHGMDQQMLEAIWVKQDAGEELTENEKLMVWHYTQWYQEQSEKRLPVRAFAPTEFINRAKRYSHLAKLKASKIILENEARCLAEEMVRYYCGRPCHICRCCGNAYEPDYGIVSYSVCPVCYWEEDGTAEDAYSDTNDATLRDYRKNFREKNHIVPLP